ncbi:MAG: DUF4340 domain-containing protein [Alcaligenaceae bacterium]|nr:DUF4340 domain-containing protein [Alcaligenaceae bacterium]
MAGKSRLWVWGLVLVAGVAGIGWQVFGTDTKGPVVRPGHHHHHGDAHEPHKLYVWEPEDALRLVVRVPGREWVLQRTAPAQWKTDQQVMDPGVFDINAYLNLLSQARIDREFLPPDNDFKPFGLEQPAIELIITGQGDTPLAALSVGHKAPDGFGRYVRIPGDENVLIVPDYQFRPAEQLLQAVSSQPPGR